MSNQKTPIKLKLENLSKKIFVEYYVPTNRRLGIKVIHISVDSKSFTLKLPYKRKNTNIGGTVHGSAIMCLAETIHGVSVLWSFDPKQHRMVTRTTKMKFINPGRNDLFVKFTLNDITISIIKEKLATRGNMDLVLGSNVTDESGKLIATLENCYNLSRKS